MLALARVFPTLHLGWITVAYLRDQHLSWICCTWTLEQTCSQLTHSWPLCRDSVNSWRSCAQSSLSSPLFASFRWFCPVETIVVEDISSSLSNYVPCPGHRQPFWRRHSVSCLLALRKPLALSQLLAFARIWHTPSTCSISSVPTAEKLIDMLLSMHSMPLVSFFTETTRRHLVYTVFSNRPSFWRLRNSGLVRRLQGPAARQHFLT